MHAIPRDSKANLLELRICCCLRTPIWSSSMSHNSATCSNTCSLCSLRSLSSPWLFPCSSEGSSASATDLKKGELSSEQDLASPGYQQLEEKEQPHYGIHYQRWATAISAALAACS